ncbi:MAG TPA: DEAD/DEAH box helicase [Candidatus Norongarragalinales archaeon]|jgi:helicase|nr:DEAD/DEAH box helicase [Candidatus Norongarragalinales archaeon]
MEPSKPKNAPQAQLPAFMPKLLEQMGLSALNPMQEKALAEGLLEQDKVVVSAPTASGKTLLATSRLIQNHLEYASSKAVYIVPLRALASEKHHELSNVLAPWGLKVGVSTGDLDDDDTDLAQYDVVVATSEKMDSLLRHRSAWMKQIGLAITDEAHLIGDEGRGATLEIVLTKLKQLDTKMLCLSATIPNARDIAEWLDAKLVKSDYRPTRLVIGVAAGSRLEFPSTVEQIDAEKASEQLLARALKTNNGTGQALVFSNTRKNAENTATNLAKVTNAFLSEQEKIVLNELSDKILKALPIPTPQCALLANLVRQGIAFHHAGLASGQRKIIEKGFKHDRCIKAISCTTTLAMGIDYPASHVIVKDLKRFTGAFSEWIPGIEVAQMVGRAGRPRYDKEGIAVLMCSPREKDAVKDQYVYGELENLYSKLSSEPALRVHTLALIASNYCNSFAELNAFFEKTFHAHQFGKTEQLLGKVERAVNELKDMDFVREKNATLSSTPVGKRVAELYLDPLSAYAFVQAIKAKSLKKPFDTLILLTKASEARPLIRVKRDEEVRLYEEAQAALDAPFDSEIDTDEYGLQRYKTAKVFNAWINEDNENAVMEQFDVAPGELHGRVKIAEWLAYSLQEIAFMLNETTTCQLVKNTRRRIKHGIKEELLELCKIRGIGRVRARKLFNAGIKTIDDYKAAPKEKIKDVIKTLPEPVQE